MAAIDKVGPSQGLPKIFRAPMHTAHRTVIFARAQLSCNLKTTGYFRGTPVQQVRFFIRLAVFASKNAK